ncbi:MAG: inositol monophosphatase family protein [Pseudonocardiaceae bacterium]
MSPDLTSLTLVALHAVDLAEAHVRTHQPRLVTPKGDRDMTTDVDLAVERMICEFLAKATPAFGFFGEEQGGGNTPTRWVLDPIDGTANFARDVPLNGISLALVHEQHAILGIIALPFLGQRYWAADGVGAWRNGQPITAARTMALSDSIVAIGDYGTGPDAPARNRVALALHAHLAPRAQRVRMLGSAAVDLVWVAGGMLDASITLGNRAWDMAAGAVIARQAGAALFDADGTPHTTSSRFTIAAAPALRNDVLAAVQAATRAQPAGVVASGVAVSRSTPHTGDDHAITDRRQHSEPC